MRSSNNDTCSFFASLCLHLCLCLYMPHIASANPAYLVHVDNDRISKPPKRAVTRAVSEVCNEYRQTKVQYNGN